VIGHRPVAADVHLAAKVAVLFAFSCSLALAQNVLPTLAIFFRESTWAAFVHVVMVALAVGLITVVVTIVYGLAARLVPRERFDDVASWSQIALALVFVSLALVTPRSTMRGTIHIDPSTWFLQILPPAWFAGLEALLAVGLPHVGHLAAAGAVALGSIVLLGRSQVLVRLSDALAAVQGERGGRRVRPLPTGLRWPRRSWSGC